MTNRMKRLRKRKAARAFGKSDSERLNNLAEEIRRLTEEFTQLEIDRPRICSRR